MNGQAQQIARILQRLRGLSAETKRRLLKLKRRERSQDQASE